jgi:hypothetical protein
MSDNSPLQQDCSVPLSPKIMAKQQGDLERMNDMFKVILELWRTRNRKITILKTKIRELKNQLKTEVR